MPPHFLPALDALLAPVIDTGRAPAMRAYMRDQFDFLGIATPQRRAAARPWLKTLGGAEQLLQYAGELWELSAREYQYIALDMLAMHSKDFSVEHIPALLVLAQNKSWWDTVDGLAGIVGDILRYSHEHMDAALKHENMWVRRIALLHQLGWRNKTDERRLFQYALAQAHEKEFFIQKAIGWALRDYARCAPDAVRAFTLKEKARLAALTFREANKHL